jgi:hypothetical protein
VTIESALAGTAANTTPTPTTEAVKPIEIIVCQDADFITPFSTKENYILATKFLGH